MSFQLSFIIVACAVLAFVQAQRDPYTIEVARNFEGSYKEHQAPGSDSSPFKNGARPSFRQYNTNTNNNNLDYNSQQQYGYSSNNQPYQYTGNGQYGQFDNSQYGQRYPQYNTGVAGNQNGFQRDPRFNSASSTTPVVAVCSAGLLALMRVVFN